MYDTVQTAPRPVIILFIPLGNSTGRPVIHHKEINMNWDIVEGNWKQFKGKVKAKWGKLTDDNLDVISGKRDQLAGKIQETYGVSKDEAEEQIKEFEEENQDIRH